MAVVVRSTEGRLPVDFTALTQPTVEVAHGTDRAFASPLGRLLKNALFASGATRSADRDSLDEFRLEIFSWKVASGTRER